MYHEYTQLESANIRAMKATMRTQLENWGTDRKYRNQFLGEGIETTREKIKSGEYKLADLNKR